MGLLLLIERRVRMRSYAAGGAREARGRATEADCCETGCAATMVMTTTGATMAAATVGSCVAPAAQTAQALLLAALRVSLFSHSGWEWTSGSIARSSATATTRTG